MIASGDIKKYGKCLQGTLSAIGIKDSKRNFNTESQVQKF